MNLNFTIKGELDDSDIHNKTQKWESRITRINARLTAFIIRAKKAVRQTMSAISSTVGMIQSIFGLLPVAINPIFTAELSAIVTTITSLHAIAAAYAAGGVTAWMTGIVEAAAIG